MGVVVYSCANRNKTGSGAKPTNSGTSENQNSTLNTDNNPAQHKKFKRSDGKLPLKPSKKQKVKSDVTKSTTKKSLARQAAMICAVTIGFCVIGYFGWQKLLEWDNIRFEKLRNT